MRDKNEFAHDVLDTLRRRRVRFRGCPPTYVELDLSGAVRVQFAGLRDGRPWVGRVKFNCNDASERLVMSDPAVVAELCESGIQLMQAD